MRQVVDNVYAPESVKIRLEVVPQICQKAFFCEFDLQTNCCSSTIYNYSLRSSYLDAPVTFLFSAKAF